jgi:probable phosphoglycerate mutase
MKKNISSALHIYLIHHGETEWALTGQHTGRTDIPLTTNGEAEARELGWHLRDIRFAHVLTSPLKRARQTCALVVPDENPKIEPDLVEWDYGEYEAKRSMDILKRRPDWNVFRDGCPHGENPAQISERADRLIARLRTLEGRIALFTHGQFGGALAAGGWTPVAAADVSPPLQHAGARTADRGYARQPLTSDHGARLWAPRISVVAVHKSKRRAVARRFPSLGRTPLR